MYLNTIFYWKTKSIFDLFSQEIAVTSEAIKITYIFICRTLVKQPVQTLERL